MDFGGNMSKINNILLYKNMQVRNVKYPHSDELRNVRHPHGKESLPEPKNWNMDLNPRRYDEWKHIMDSITKTREGYAK